MLIFLLSLCLLVTDGAHEHDWDYGEYGPAVWGEMYPTCDGEYQSPINILTACTTYKAFTPFVFASGYKEEQNFTLKNNGHTIVGTLSDQTRLDAFRVTGGDLNGAFEFVNFHLHWGENHKSGSEHEVNGVQYSGGIHFVYQNPLTNQTAVLGVFMRSVLVMNDTENSSFTDTATHHEWQRYFNIAQTLHLEDDTVVLDLSLGLLMGENLDQFWRYIGSLTTPPCTEGILWTLFRTPILFSENEFRNFRQNIYFEDYRSPQPVYNRVVYRNFPNETFSTVPDYNSCPGKNRNLLSNDQTSSFPNRSICSIFLVMLITSLFY